jgi:hypothetical protein
MIKWNVTKVDAALIRAIVKRAVRMAKVHNIGPVDVLSLDMDITACHLNGNPLRLEELLGADDANFGHDVWGIHRYMDRNTGKLTDFFLPRFAKHEKKAVA